MLLLKNTIKEVFKELGMPEGLTVSRTSNKYIAITGECGRNILTITKVEVGTKLTKAERGIVINDYILPILTEHKQQILKYIELLKDVKIQDRINELTTTYRLESNRSYRSLNYNYATLNLEDITVSLNVEGEFKISTSDMSDTTYKTDIKKALDIAYVVLPEYLKLLDASKVQDENIKAVREALSEKCGVLI